MKALRVVFRLGLLIGLVVEILGSPTTAQTTTPKETLPQHRDCELIGDDARRSRSWIRPLRPR